MKTKFILAAALILVLSMAGIGLTGCTTTGAVAQDLQPLNIGISSQQGIWVNGEGRITVTPDIATVSLGVSAQASTVAEAQSQAATAMDRVIAALRDNDVEERDIQTQFFSIQPITRYDKDTQQSVVTGYMVSNIVLAKIRDIDETGAIIDAVAAAGGDNTRVNGVSFSVDNPEQYHSQAREQAVNNARAKAEQLARLAGVNLGRVIYISESAAYTPIPFPVPVLRADAIEAAPTTFISPGETDIILNIQVNYAIQ